MKGLLLLILCTCFAIIRIDANEDITETKIINKIEVLELVRNYFSEGNPSEDYMVLGDGSHWTRPTWNSKPLEIDYLNTYQHVGIIPMTPEEELKHTHEFYTDAKPYRILLHYYYEDALMGIAFKIVN